ncbi:MFS transporter [Enorma sp.]|uniref:MFS transporter n=1 Tax=Enorma sp. TaxID=1920692 RepID=UPI003AB45434
MFYLGVQAAYFIGIVGVLTYELKASTMALAAAVGIFNLCIIVANACGGTLLDVKGPRVHTAATVAVVVASCLVYQIVEVSVVSVLAMSAAFGFSCGMGFPYLTAYPAYLTHRSGELQQVNALLSVASNAAVAVGPAIGGIIASVFPAQRVFVFPAVLGVAAIVPAAALLKQIAATGMRSLHGLEDASSVYVNEGMQGDAGEAAASVPTVEKGTFGDSVRTVMGSSVLSLLFWGGVLAYAGYGAFDPLESLYYRDVLHVGIAWMGWLSSAAGVGSFAGAMLSLRVPNSWVNVRTLLLLIALQGAACLLYVGTPFVICALAGQVLLGCAFGMITPLQNTLVQMRAPKHLLGRVNSVMNAGFNGAGVIPLFAAPVLADMFGVQAVLLGASAFVLIVPIVCLALRRDAA